ncbi:probable LRR receptor-like serine/threonine-protein kinase At1g07650 [Typha angustifolia]|uniref:probable LRR receptor-like serine/threonine-protein kinase At1g07650 n=1 Tax=Typha angustifolia TaxID=59011 RepID=UPI003C2C2313
MRTNALAFFFFLFFHLLPLALRYPNAIATSLPKLYPPEVHALRGIASKLGKADWDFSVDPCSGKGNWRVPDPVKDLESHVICDCSFSNNSVCRITAIALKSQNLSGVLPPEFGVLRHLQQLDLSRNVLNGTMPNSWALMTGLQGLSLMGNRLSGPFPMALTKMITLTNLSIEGNNFHGPLPPHFGDLVNLEKLVLSANEFIGELPASLAKLTNLTDLRISGNNFSGRIPDFIQKWTKLEKLRIQGSSLEGPIPSGISKLTSLNDLRISDLRGKGSAFPDLSGMESLRTLILRNCSIHGNIPSYIGMMKKLKELDLSFNKLSGEIPNSFSNLGVADFIYLTENMLTGHIPGWILKGNKNVDISFNNFTLGNAGPTQCLQSSVNVVESYSHLLDKRNDISSCLKSNFPCSASGGTYKYSLHINCGGKEVTINKTKFEADEEPRGASMLYLGSNWAFSSTGNFLDNAIDADNYIATSTSKLPMTHPELYTGARLSPLSLTYYGLCMMNGNYTVELHFAEIVFTNDNTFSSLGKRLFNVFIQGKMVLEDFNIEKAAGGVGKPVIKTFTTLVTNNTMKIHLYWAGKGTEGIPERGNYGPLISAISVRPNFEPPHAVSGSSASKRIHITLGVGISVLVFFLTLLALGIWWKNNSMYKDLRALDLQIGSFTLSQIKAATRNFDAANKIGEGGFGSVYKGLLLDGTTIAVKQLSSKSMQGNREFVNEIGMISALQHPNLVKLYGCCTEGNQLLLVYEYMENNCLARALFDSQGILKLDWPTRHKICLGIARGMAHLHEGSTLRIIHRDIKASNILLDRDLNPKISDFGLAKLNEEDHSHISTRVAGTIGYMAPEYAMRGYLTDKADVYSFGVVALETVSGKSNTNYRPKEEFVYLLDWACVLQERGTLLDLVDPDLGLEYSRDEALVVLNVALLCTNASPTLRPTMSEVVSLLEGRTPLQQLLSDLSLAPNSLSSAGVRRSFWQNPSESQSFSISGSYINLSESFRQNDASIQYLIESEIS